MRSEATMKPTKDEFLSKMMERYPVHPDVAMALTPRLLAEILVVAGVLDEGIRGYKPDELAEVCPVCHACVDEECRTVPRGALMPSPHAQRIEAAQRVELANDERANGKN